VCATYGPDSIFLWRRFDTLCTSGFVDDIMFALVMRACPRVRVRAQDNESYRPTPLQNYTKVYMNMASERNFVLSMKNLPK